MIEVDILEPHSGKLDVLENDVHQSDVRPVSTGFEGSINRTHHLKATKIDFIKRDIHQCGFGDGGG